MSFLVIAADVREGLRGLRPEQFHCCVTSPPYLGLRDYGLPPTAWSEVRYCPMSGVGEIEVEAWEGVLGLEPTVEMYVGHIVAVFRELWRVLRDDGTVWLNLGDTYKSSSGNRSAGSHRQAQRLLESGVIPHSGANRTAGGLARKNLIGVPWRVAFALQADGWFLREDIVWEKPNAMPWAVRDRPSVVHEMVFLLSRSPTYFYDELGWMEPTTGNAHARGRGVHPKSAGLDRPRGVRANASYSAAVKQTTGAWRRARSVWRIQTRPASTPNHFATFPLELPDRCIRLGTSAKGACGRCGAPRRRIVDRRRLLDGQPHSGAWSHDKRLGKAMGPNRPDAGIGQSRFSTEVATLGWRATCKCRSRTVPCKVLDPFVGSGRSLQAALLAGRHSVGIDACIAFGAEARGGCIEVSPGHRLRHHVRLQPIEGPLFSEVSL